MLTQTQPELQQDHRHLLAHPSATDWLLQSIPENILTAGSWLTHCSGYGISKQEPTTVRGGITSQAGQAVG